MFSTVTEANETRPVQNRLFVHTACGSESSMNMGGFETYTQSTGTTTTTTLLYL